MAEIAHDFAEQTTGQTHTGDNTWTDISGAAIASGSFSTGDKYLIICKANSGIDNGNGNFGIRVLHGSTIFGTSVDQREPRLSAVDMPYLWFTVWTAIASEGIKMQFATVNNTGDTVRSDQITMFIMNLSDDVTENTDWYFDEDVSDTSLDTSQSSSNNAAVTFTPSGNSDWLVMTTSRIDVSAANIQFESIIDSSGDVTDTEPKVSVEGEDPTYDYFVFSLLRVFALTNQSNTFTEKSRVDSGSGAGPRKSSAIFALNLEKFVDHEDIYTAAEIALTTVAWEVEVQTLSITPSQTADTLILSHYIYDGDQNLHGSRVQVDGTDQPTGQTALTYPWVENDATDEAIIAHMTVENLDNTSHTVDIDAYVDATTNTPAAEDRTILILPLELAPVAGTGVKNPLLMGRNPLIGPIG